MTYRGTDDDLPAIFGRRIEPANRVDLARERIARTAAEMCIGVTPDELTRFAVLLVAIEEAG
jgi:hypothetical protein